jgi:SAM-dependent methyltransferase
MNSMTSEKQIAKEGVIHRCRGCHAGHLTVVFTMEPMPLAGQFCNTYEAALVAKRYPLTWVQCDACRLVQVAEDIPSSELFEVYNYSSSSVTPLVRHFTEYAKMLEANYGRDAVVNFLEIGCNDGVLLKQLSPNWSILGVDPSDVAAKASVNEGFPLANKCFTTEFVIEQKLVGAVDVITGSNCLAHISDLFDVFRACALALRKDGELWIEVHDLDALLKANQWDTIYHEHKVEWSRESLAACVCRHGFELRDIYRLSLHGGLLRARFRRCDVASKFPKVITNNKLHLETLQKSYNERHTSLAAQSLAGTTAAGGHIAAYGASGRANVYLNQMPFLKFAFIVDESPLRIGKFLPCVGTPIVDRAELVRSNAKKCLVTAWNYASEIRSKNRNFSGEWLTAFCDV